jgi:hypothetical protein
MDIHNVNCGYPQVNSGYGYPKRELWQCCSTWPLYLSASCPQGRQNKEKNTTRHLTSQMIFLATKFVSAIADEMTVCHKTSLSRTTDLTLFLDVTYNQL